MLQIRLLHKLKLHSDTIDFVMTEAKQSNNASIAKTVQPATITRNMQVFPNPASSTIKVRVNGTATIVLTNSAGKIMLSKNINNNASINVSGFANGIYYIQNKTTGEVQKIVVSH